MDKKKNQIYSKKMYCDMIGREGRNMKTDRYVDTYKSISTFFLCHDDCEAARDDWITKISEITKPHTPWVS